MRFAAPDDATPEAPGGLLGAIALPPAMAARLAETALLALVALAAILLLGRPVVGRLAAALAPPTPALAGGVQALAGPGGELAAGAAALPRAAGAGAALPPGAEGGDPRALPPGDEELVSLAHVQGQMRASSLAKLTRLVEAHPDETLTVIRRWLEPGED
jgi:flagellar M-ring protein FliF